ncbi:MAG: UDP-N-acetylmuramate--L-alanine ligase [Thermodesulfobacteriota bacterium]|nr:MAG: UDP-N-acetylmuramate--L-alanine ligase [Thermodesulfobacteriota bacterium]
MLNKKRKIHFIGIGGVGMSGIASILASLGHEVSGCDIAKNKYTKTLEKQGIKVYYGHSPEHLKDIDIVVYSSAIPADNPELLKAKEMKLWVIPRAQMLSEIMNLHPKSIVVAGSHGKTTTTSMIAEILISLNKNPTVVVGGIINNIKTHSILGESKYLVAEADESDGSFLCYNPYIEVITNIDKEHLDFYADFKAIKKAFINFIQKCSQEGKVILCGDDEGIKEVMEEISGPFLLYGFSENNLLKGKILEDTAYPLVEVFYKNTSLGILRLSIPGKHNVLNALGAIGVALELNLPIKKVLKILKNFKGTLRRFEFKGIWRRSILLDDYAHHPKEIEVTLETIRKVYPDKTLILIFQPHRYTRVKALWEDFLLVLKEPEILILTDIYPASETPIPGISGETFFESVKEIRNPKPTFFVKNFEDIKKLLEKLVFSNQLIATMGAGNIYKLHNLLICSSQKETGYAT